MVPPKVSKEIDAEIKRVVKQVCDEVDLKKPSAQLSYMIGSAFLEGAIWREKKLKRNKKVSLAGPDLEIR